jgi:hypothetical protein
MNREWEGMRQEATAVRLTSYAITFLEESRDEASRDGGPPVNLLELHRQLTKHIRSRTADELAGCKTSVVLSSETSFLFYGKGGSFYQEARNDPGVPPVSRSTVTNDFVLRRNMQSDSKHFFGLFNIAFSSQTT